MIPIKTDSRKVMPGDTFVAITGFTVDGHDYIDKAIELGATRVVCTHGSYPVETIVVKDTKKWLQDELLRLYQKDLEKIKIIGMTGTNGKTTTCFLTYQLLNALGKKCAYLGTIGFYLEDLVRELPNTTPETIDLFDMVVEASQRGYEYIVMEASSHALDQDRLHGLQLVAGAFSNFTEDHLDYHKTFEAYLTAKKKILNYLTDDAKMIVNMDDPYGKEFIDQHAVTLGMGDTDIKLLDQQDTLTGTHIHFSFYGKEYEVDTSLKCLYNVYNYLTCFGLAYAVGCTPEDILAHTKELHAPKGRCEQVNYHDGLVVVDYAHTPDAVDKIVSAFNENKQGKVITLVGCGGDRDPKKRPIMGHIAASKSDFAIFTSDNPRTEDPKEILKQIVGGVDTKNYIVEENRIEAIHKGMDMIGKGDVLLILGKGHEDYQIIGHEKHHLDDMEEVKKYMA